VLFLGNVIVSLFEGPMETSVDASLSDPLSGPEDSPKVLDNLWLWTAIAVVLVVLAYSLPIAAIISDGGLFGPGTGTYPAWLLGVLP